GGGARDRGAGAELAGRGLLRLRDPPAVHQDAAGGGRERPGQHVDEGGLAGAVRADQGVARSRLEAEVDVLRDGQRAEAFAELFCLKSCRHLSTRPRMPPGAKRTTVMSRAPTPKYQYSGYCLASQSCTMR